MIFLIAIPAFLLILGLIWFLTKPSSHVTRFILVTLLGVSTLYLTLQVGLHVGRQLTLADAHNLCLRPIGITLTDIREHFNKGNKVIAEAKFRYLVDNWFGTQLLPGKTDTNRMSFAEFLFNIDAIGKNSN